jgi:pyrimidine-nucleoside phosphorylase
MQKLSQASRLAHLLVTITQRAGRQSTALLTDMSQPLGNAVGNALELHEAIETLQGCGPADLRELSLSLGAELLIMAGKARTSSEGQSLLSKLLRSGAALEKFLIMVRNQSGDVRAVEEPSRLPQSRERLPMLARRSGYVRQLQARAVGEAAHLLGAGRSAQGEAIDHAVGVELVKKVGDEVGQGEPLAYLHVNDKANLECALQKIEWAYRIGRVPPKPRPLIRGSIAQETSREGV